MQALELSSEDSARFANMSFACACLVVLIHIEICPAFGVPLWWVEQLFEHNEYSGMTRIAVPFFFFASGFFLAGRVDAQNWYLAEVKKRVRTLVIPFLLWNMIYFCFLRVMIGMCHAVGYEFHVPISRCSSVWEFLGQMGIDPLHWCVHGHLWFLRSLFVFILCAPMIVWAVRKLHRWNWLLLFAAAGAVLQISLDHGRFWGDVISYYYSLEGLLYFALGIFMRFNGLPGGYGVLCIAGGLSLFGVSVLAVYFTWSVGIVFWLKWCATPLLMYGLWSVMPRRNVLGPLAGCAFPIYILHKFMLLLVAGAAGALGMREYLAKESVVLYFGRMVLVVALVCLFVKGLERVCPRVAAWLFGGRTAPRISSVRPGAA